MYSKKNPNGFLRVNKIQSGDTLTAGGDFKSCIQVKIITFYLSLKLL